MLYRAAVAKHSVINDRQRSNEQNLQSNLYQYVSLMKLAKDQDGKVIVFPEFGLTPQRRNFIIRPYREDIFPFAEEIPTISKDKYQTPYYDEKFVETSILKTISRAAKEIGILTLINMIEKVPKRENIDKNNKEEDFFLYNTNVLFNENGELVLKYRKTHEWYPFIPSYDQYEGDQIPVYTSSFGVTFGVFTCFDICFSDPAMEMRELGVKHFLYPVAQHNLLASILIQPWSRKNVKLEPVTHLSANLDIPADSGIYNNGKTLNCELIFLDKNKNAGPGILIADIQI